MDSEPGARRVVLIVSLGGFALFLGVYALFPLMFGTTPVWTSASEVCRQPDEISYQEGSSYSVYVVKPELRVSLFGGTESSAVVSTSGGGNYGINGIYIELNPSTDPDLVSCRWEPDSVVIVEPNGITHEVPASAFTGGR